MMRLRLLLLLLCVLAGAVLACAGDSRGAGSSAAGRATTPSLSGPVTGGAGPEERAANGIKIAAASDLRRALAALQPALEQACRTKLTYVFGSSGQLKEQILAGADYHLFLSADTGYVEELERAGSLVPNGRANYAVGRLALAWRSGLAPLGSVADVARPDVKRIAIANPAHAPYGRAAQQALTSARLWDTIQDRLVLGENIRQTTDYVQQGNADAGLVALALVLDTDTHYVVLDAALHAPVIQAGGVAKGTHGELTARCVLQYLLDPAGQEALKKSGFEPVPAP